MFFFKGKTFLLNNLKVCTIKISYKNVFTLTSGTEHAGAVFVVIVFLHVFMWRDGK